MNMLSGPVGVVKIIGEETARGVINLVSILGVISANIGIVNLLPIPALDGGRAIMLIIEGIRGKSIDRKYEYIINAIGMAFLFGLMIFITLFNDIPSLIR